MNIDRCFKEIRDSCDEINILLPFFQLIAKGNNPIIKFTGKLGTTTRRNRTPKKHVTKNKLKK